MKLKVYNCSDSYTCLSYHTEFVSQCCSASTSKIQRLNGKKVTKQLSTDDQAEATYAEQCDGCGAQCKLIMRHKRSV